MQIYQAWPTIPYGCLYLQPIVAENDEKTSPDTASTAAAQSDAPFSLTDGMEVFAFIDEQRVTPILNESHHGSHIMDHQNCWHWYHLYSVRFDSTESDGNFHSSVTVRLVRDGMNSRWCDLRHFTQVKDVYGTMYNEYRAVCPIPWFPSLVECLLASPERIPRSAEVMDHIEAQFDAMQEKAVQLIEN